MKTIEFASKWSYDMDWSHFVTGHCVKKYARATEILGECFFLFHKDFANMLAHNSPLWPITRDIMHYLDYLIERWGLDCTKYNTKDWITKHMLSSGNAKDAKFFEVDLISYLTEFRAWLVLISQGFRGY